MYEWLKDDTVRYTLGAAGAALVALVSAGWAVFRYFRSSDPQRKNDPQVSIHSDRGSVSVGRDIRDSKVSTQSKKVR
jgi:hypothetical protein